MIENIIKKITALKGKILTSKGAKTFEKKHPAAFEFILKRFSLKKFYGLPLTILLISVFLNLLLMLDVTKDVLEKDVINLDNFIAGFFFNIRSEPIAKFFHIITQICNINTVTIVAAIVAVYFFVKKNFHFIPGILISLAGSGITISLGKSVFKITRPHQYSDYYENLFSFPSGHTTIAVAFYGLLFYFIGRSKMSIKKWSKIIITALTFFIIIGISRLYLSVHYFSDVIAGYLLGLFWLLLSISFIEWREHRQKQRL